MLFNFFFSFFLYFRNGYACQCIYRWWRERQRNGNCTRRPCYGSLRSVSWRLYWQEKPPPSLPQSKYLVGIYESSRRVSSSAMLSCCLQIRFTSHVKNSFSHRSTFLMRIRMSGNSLWDGWGLFTQKSILGSEKYGYCHDQWALWLGCFWGFFVLFF